MENALGRALRSLAETTQVCDIHVWTSPGVRQCRRHEKLIASD